MARAHFGQGDRLYGLPIEVHMAGFRSTTDQLGRNGWELLSEFDPARLVHRFMFRHSGLRLWGMADDYYIRDALKASYLSGHPHGAFVPIVVGPQHLARDIVIRGAPPKMQWLDINSEPVLLSQHEYMQQISMTGLFPVRDEQQDVYVEEADEDVLDYLQKIVEMQRPKQAALREKALEQEQPQIKETARIIQLGNYR